MHAAGSTHEGAEGNEGSRGYQTCTAWPHQDKPANLSWEVALGYRRMQRKDGVRGAY